MGITIGNKTSSIDMGYIGFYRLRHDIAGVFGKKFKKLYFDWIEGKDTDEEGNTVIKDMYDRGELTDQDDLIIQFLFASDCDGKLSYEGCKRLYELIEDYGDNSKKYGYIGWGDYCATFADFKQIVKDCSIHRWIMTWNQRDI